MSLSCSSNYSVNATGGFSFGVAYGDGKGDLVPKTTHLSSHNVDFWLDIGDFFSYQSRDYPSMSHLTKYRKYYS